MKYYLACFAFLLSPTLLAGYGIVTTLEAPVVRDIDVNSPTVMTVRKGQKIYIHDKYFKYGPYDVTYTASDREAGKKAMLAENEAGYEQFYETIDKNGRTAYISRYFVKLITQDVREFTQNISPFEPDPGDYRVEEPLPEGYPIVSPEMGRARISLSVGPDLKSNYDYSSFLTEEDFSDRYGFEISFGKKANWDNEDRFYFGGIVQAWTSEASFTLFDDRLATESRSQLSVGPYISYDPWRRGNYKLTVQAALLLSYTRNLVEQTDTIGNNEQRLYSGLGFQPRLSSYMQIKTFTEGVYFVSGFDVQFYMPQTLTTNTEAVTPLWNNVGQDTLDIPFSAHWALFIGVQTNY